jgi:lysophospholipase L1-like esterase
VPARIGMSPYPRALALVFLLVHTLASSNFIPVTDSNLVFSRFNFDVSNATSAARASNPGASLFFAVSNTASVSLVVDTSASTSSPCTVLAYTVDGGPWTSVSPAPGNASQLVVLASSLSPAQTHTARVFLYASCEQSDRWLFTPASQGGNAFFVVNGVALDDGGSSAPLPAGFLRPGQMVVYGDSISEGTNAQNYNFATGSCGNDLGLRNSGSVDSWAFALGEALNAEVSLCAFAAQGYVTINSENYGNVPRLLTLQGQGAEAASAWDKISASTSRLPLLQAQPPDYVVNALGFNDQNSDVSAAVLTETVATWLSLIRNATSPSTSVLMVMPFGGEMRTQNVTRDALLAGFAQYKATAQGQADPCAVLLDLYPRAQPGLQGLGAPTAQSCDGTHPLARRHGQLGAMVAVEAILALQQPAASSCKRTFV